MKEVNIDPGYKKTPAGWIPEDWECRAFTDIFTRISDFLKPEPHREYREIGIRSHGKGVFHKEPVLGSKLGEKRVFWCKPNTLAFNIVFAWEQAVALVSEKEAGMIASHRFPMYKGKKSVAHERFFLWFFKSPRGKHSLGLASPGGAGRNKTLGQGELDFLHVPVPPYPEQKKIADILSTWEQAIKQTRVLIDAKKRRKKALMQQLLTGKCRLPGFGSSGGPTSTSAANEGRHAVAASRTTPTARRPPEGWRVMKFRDIAALEYGREWKSVANVSGNVPVFGTGGIIGRASSQLGYGPTIIIGRKGSIDQPQMVDGPFWAVDTTFYINPIQEVDMDWLHATLCLRGLARYSEASGVPSLSRSTLESLDVLTPPFPEQRAIADVLSAADTEIVLLESKLAALEKQKRGLMQKLLTGEVRVKCT